MPKKRGNKTDLPLVGTPERLYCPHVCLRTTQRYARH